MTVHLAGDLKLAGPLTYFHDRMSGLGNEEPAAVDVSLAVSPAPYVPAGEDLGYWPRYVRLTPQQRRYYLDWLAGGRAAWPAATGYAFLFLYGLERRALVDGADAALIFDEVMRLRQLHQGSSHATSRSFETYTSSFLWFLMVRDAPALDSPRFRQLAESCAAWSEDNLAAMLSWLHTRAGALPAWAAFILAAQLPRAQQSVVARRVGHELRDLFCKRFGERYANALALQAAKRLRRFAYRPASAALASSEALAPHPLGVASQFNDLCELYNACIADLRRLSAVRSDGVDHLTVDAWIAMPAELRAGVDHPLAGPLCALINAHVDEAGHTIVGAHELASALAMPATEKLTVVRCRRLCEIAADIGYCVEPDARLVGRAYKPEQRLAVYLNTSEQEPDLARYAAAACMLSVGLALASADGKIEEDELALLTQQLDATFELNDAEQRRLQALRSLLVSQGVDLAELSRVLKGLAVAQREPMAKLILALVAADAVVAPEELKALRRLYASMGFSREEVDRAIDSLAGPQAAVDEPVTIQPAMPGRAGEPIPPPPPAARSPADKGLRLNRDAIAAIMADTREVAQLLAAAMQAEHADDLSAQRVVVADPATPIGQDGPTTMGPPTALVAGTATPTEPVRALGGVPARYAAIYADLIARGSWTEAEAAELARRHGLMLAGALEAINDWSTDRHGGPLFYVDAGQLVRESAYLN